MFALWCFLQGAFVFFALLANWFNFLTVGVTLQAACLAEYYHKAFCRNCCANSGQRRAEQSSPLTVYIVVFLLEDSRPCSATHAASHSLCCFRRQQHSSGICVSLLELVLMYSAPIPSGRIWTLLNSTYIFMSSLFILEASWREITSDCWYSSFCLKLHDSVQQSTLPVKACFTLACKLAFFPTFLHSHTFYFFTFNLSLPLLVWKVSLLA